MESIIIFGILAAGIALGAVGGYLWARTHTMVALKDVENKTKACEDLAKERDELRAATDSLRNELSTQMAENARLAEQLRQESEERANIRRDSETVFRELASTILDEKSRAFKESNESRLAEILNPFKENVETLRKTISDCYTGEVSEVKSLKESLRMLTELNTTIGREAKELTGALRGNSKVQGDWGEMVLRRILENSGLKEGVNYVLQATTNFDGSPITGDEGNRLRPDALFCLPDRKCIVIDSKTSLTAYTDYVNATDEASRAAALKAHLASVRKHIDELADKHYDGFVKGAADFVMMFVPNEAAYMATMQADNSVWEYAYGRRVVIVSPTHLMSVMQLMNQLWTQDKQNKNAQRIAEETGKLYDKLAAFVKDFNGIRAALGGALDKYDDALARFSTGRGNVLSRFEKIKQLGAKTAKSLDEYLDSDEEGAETGQ